jgi:beta-N-acetylhexosaminidase
VAALQNEGLAGLGVTAAKFTPTSSTHAGAECIGARFEVTDRAAFEPVRLGVAIARALRDLYPDAWHADKLDKIIGNKPITDAILDRRPLADIESLWSTDLEAFRAKRKKYFLYPDDVPR